MGLTEDAPSVRSLAEVDVAWLRNAAQEPVDRLVKKQLEVDRKTVWEGKVAHHAIGQ